jgi:hypothetical protein
MESKFKNKIISLIVGILMNPILLVIIFLVDSPTSNVWLHGKPLLERTPFAYTYFWSSVFLPGNPPAAEPAMLAAVITNTCLYFVLSYFILGQIRKKHA